MSKRVFFGTEIDEIFRSSSARSPGTKVYIWNPNRTTINDVVLQQEESPRYDITPWVLSMNYNENITFENSEDSQSSSVTIEMQYDPDAQPIQITEKTMLDGTPIRIYQGDTRVDENKWVPIFTGVLRGNPAIPEEDRNVVRAQTMSLIAVDRAEAFINTLVTAKSYEQNSDIGGAIVSTAIEYMGLDRAEISFGFQDYAIGHPQSQLVDMEIMKGIAQMLFCIGKKPKFDNEGFLCAADTDLSKAPARVHETKELIKSITREAVATQMNNSVRLLGLSNQLTKCVERRKRLAHGSITSGFFEDAVRQKVSFSENQGEEEGGRRARNVVFKKKLSRLGGTVFGEHVHFDPIMASDGESCFGVNITFDTGYDSQIRITLLTVWAVAKTTQVTVGLLMLSEGEASSSAYPTVCLGDEGVGYQGHAMGTGIATAGALLSYAGEIIAAAAMVAIILSLTELGRLDWEAYGEPFQYVYQQLCATAQLNGLLSDQIREIQFRNDWIYDLETLEIRAKELLKRELIKGWCYSIVMIDDPLLEVDDIIQIGTKKFYITSIQKSFSRGGVPDGTMRVGAWRFA